MRKFLLEIFVLLGKDKERLPSLLFLFLFVSLLDLAGIGLIGPYIAMITSPEAADGIAIKLGSWVDLPADTSELLILMGLVLIVIFFVKAVLTIWINYVIARFSQGQQVRLRSLLMKHYMSMSYTEYIGRNSSEYIHRIQTQVGEYAGAVQMMLKTISDMLVALVILLFLVWTSPLALSLLVVLFGLFLVIYDVSFRKNISMLGRQTNLATTNMLQATNEGIEGLKEVRILGCKSYFQHKVDESAKNLAMYTIKTDVISSAPRYILELIMVFFVVVLTVITIEFMQNVGQLLPTLAMIGVAAVRLLPAANGLSTNLMRLRYYADSVSKLYKDSIATLFDESSSQKSQQGKKIIPFNDISLKSVTFRYPDSKNDALHQISMDIKCGESIGLIGTSGSGKTTLVDTLLGLLTPISGEIFFNGCPLKESLGVWRSHVAYLPQQVFLIDNTLRNNVALGVESEAVDEQRLSNALQMALLSGFVEQLPDGLDTMLGEKGVRLSGGQRQRVALARAFYHERDVLVLDEATSALDTETEQEITAEIQRLKGKKTMIVIAHRFSTIRHCDRIYQLENGKIVASGTPKEVLNNH